MKKIIFLLVFTSNAFITNAQVNIQDSLALVALYNSTDGPNWVGCNGGWLVAPANQWYGITVDSGRVTEIFLGGGIIGYDCELTGTIPPEIGNLTKLKILDLANNNLSGQIPIDIYNLSELELLFLYNNNLAGELDTNIGNLVNLHGLYLYNNQLSGELPDEIGNLINLSNLEIDYNNLSGSIPTTLLNLHQINYFFIHHNQFTDLPDLTSLYYDNLRFFGIDYNKFTFEDIEPNIIIPWEGFSYTHQDSVYNYIDTSVFIHSTMTINSLIGGAHNIYQWKKNDSVIISATDSVLILNNILPNDSGIYNCEITNTIVPNLTIARRPIAIHVIDTATAITLIDNTDFNIHLTDKKMLEIYNPSTFSIQWVEIINSTGALVYKENKIGNEINKEINLQFLPIGIYYVTVKSTGSSFQKKVLIY